VHPQSRNQVWHHRQLAAFLKFAFNYKADIGESAADNTPNQPRQSA
jgi:hypothetical protein